MTNNPAWEEYLSEIPEDLHDKVTPAFEKWDASVQEQFGKYAPWKEVMESAKPESVQFALNFVNALESDPKLVYNTIGEYYKLTEQEKAAVDAVTGGQPHQETGESNSAYERRLAAIEEQNRVLAEYLVNQRNTSQQEAETAKAEQALDAELKALTAKYGEYDEMYVLGLMQSGIPAEDAVKRYKAMETRLAGSTMPRPLFAGAGGTGLPSGNINPTKASDSDTRKIVEQMLAQAAATRRSG